MKHDDTAHQPLVLRDEIFDEIINGYRPIEQKVDDQQILLKEGQETAGEETEYQKDNDIVKIQEDRPKSEIISPVIRKRIENAGKVAFNTKQGRNWLTLSFGEILAQREEQEERHRTFFEKIQEKREAAIEHHRNFTKHSLRNVFNLFLKLRAIIRVFNDLKEIVIRTKRYFEKAKPQGMSNSEFIMKLIHDEDERKQFFSGLMDEISESVRNTIIDTLSVVLVPFVTLVLDVTKEILVVIMKECFIAIAKVVAKKIPFINRIINKVHKNTVSSVSNGVKNALAGATRAITSSSGKIVNGVISSSKAASKAVTVVTKVATSKAAKVATKGVSIAAKGTMKAGGVAAKVVSYPIRAVGRYAVKKGEAIVTNVRSGVRVGVQNPVEIMAMLRMTEEGFGRIQEYANMFFGSFVKGEQDNTPRDLALIIEQVSAATVDRVVGFLGAAELHVPDQKNFSYDAESKKATITIDGVAYSSLWTQLFNTLFQGIQQKTGEYFRSVSMFETEQEPQQVVHERNQYNGTRFITLTTLVKSRIFGETDYTIIRGFDIDIVNGKDEVKINTKDNTFIFNGHKKDSTILKDISNFLFSEDDFENYIDEDSSITPEKSTASTVNNFQKKTLTIEDNICKLCKSINDIAINVGIALNNYYKTANGE